MAFGSKLRFEAIQIHKILEMGQDLFLPHFDFGTIFLKLKKFSLFIF